VSEVVPTELESVPAERTSFHRLIGVLVGIVAVTASLLGILEADATRHENLDQARSQRASVELFGDIAASSVFHSFGLTTLQDATADAITATARQLATLARPQTAAVEAPRAKAEGTAAQRLIALVKQLSAEPTAKSGVDPATRAAMTASVAQLQETVRAQGESVDRAERYARRGARAILGLSLAASAAALLGLAGVVGVRRAGRILFGVAVLAWLGAIVSAALALAV
jgi:hypothetical protein